MKTDILVIGSGIAGLSFAIKSADFADITIITKADINECNTELAQGGLAVALAEDDSYELHIKDTLKAGDGLCDKKAVRFLVENAKQELMFLEELGVNFEKLANKFILSKEAAHSRARIVHASDFTGMEIEKKLIKAVKGKVEIKTHHKVVKLMVKNNRCYGAIAIKNGNIIKINAKATILATGGIGQLYKYTSNSEVATGDGIALAYDVGAVIQDMEFVQFHPTGLHNSKPSFLISETLRGEGAILKNIYNKPFMKHYHKDGDLAPRDIVSRAIVQEMKKTNSEFVYLDISHIDSSYIKKRFPNIYKRCLEYGTDLTKEPIKVSPIAHYLCGGVKINLRCETNIAGLYAIGEVACSGIHGADRLASNSLIEALVFSTSATKAVRKYIKDKAIKKMDIKFDYKDINNKIEAEIKDIMWKHVGIIRSCKGLNYALNKLNLLSKKFKSRLIEVAKLITKSALIRKESRGTHYIKEYPYKKDAWLKHIAWKRYLKAPLFLSLK